MHPKLFYYKTIGKDFTTKMHCIWFYYQNAFEMILLKDVFEVIFLLKGIWNNLIRKCIRNCFYNKKDLEMILQ